MSHGDASVQSLRALTCDDGLEHIRLCLLMSTILSLLHTPTFNIGCLLRLTVSSSVFTVLSSLRIVKLPSYDSEYLLLYPSVSSVSSILRLPTIILSMTVLNIAPIHCMLPRNSRILLPDVYYPPSR